MSSIYKAVNPQAQKDQYNPSEYVDFLLTYLNEALSQDCVHLSGELVVQTQAGADVGVLDPIYFNHRTGIHGALDAITTEMNAQGVSEKLDDYPSYVSVTTLGSELPLERGTTTPSARELRVPTAENARALCEHANATSPLSFCVKLRNAINKFNQPVNYDTCNEVRIRIRLADNLRFLYATDGSTPTYYLKNLKMHYKTIPPINYQGPLTTEVINSDRQNLTSTSQAISMLIPTGTTDSLVARCIRASRETDTTYDKLACEPVPGIVPGTQNLVNDRYGFHRIIYSVNDIDSSPINFNLESREEIIVNYLRALREDWKYKYGYQLIDNNNAGLPDSYAIGVNFGGLVDFSKQSFTMNLESQIDTANSYNIYLHSRSLIQVA